MVSRIYVLLTPVSHKQTAIGVAFVALTILRSSFSFFFRHPAAKSPTQTETDSQIRTRTHTAAAIMAVMGI